MTPKDVLQATYPCAEMAEPLCVGFHPDCMLAALSAAGYAVVPAGDVAAAIGRIHGRSLILPPPGQHADAVDRLRLALGMVPT